MSENKSKWTVSYQKGTDYFRCSKLEEKTVYAHKSLIEQLQSEAFERGQLMSVTSNKLIREKDLEEALANDRKKFLFEAKQLVRNWKDRDGDSLNITENQFEHNLDRIYKELEQPVESEVKKE